MTYRLEPIIEKIHSPVILVYPDGLSQQYGSGTEVAAAVFDKRYVIESLSTVDDKIRVELKEARMSDSTTWVGEEEVSFF